MPTRRTGATGDAQQARLAALLAGDFAEDGFDVLA